METKPKSEDKPIAKENIKINSNAPAPPKISLNL